MHDITELQKLIDTKKLFSDRINSDQEALLKIEASIRKTCPHPSTIKRTSYSSGGYDYRSVSKSWDQCTICEKVFNLKEVEGSFQ
jgi:hypothetical protein